MDVTAKILSKGQILAGFLIEQDDHIVTLKFKDKIVGNYSASGVTIDTLRKDADTFMNGIEFTKQS